jgi:alanine dehydrogenase
MTRPEVNPKTLTFQQQGLLPQEEKLEVAKKHYQLTIGVPKEINIHESRIPLTPEAVEGLVNKGHVVMIEKGAGISANYSDTDFSEKGGLIVDNADIYRADIILKIAPLTVKEIGNLRENQIVLSSLHSRDHSEEYIRGLMQKRITAVSFENIKDQNNCYPIVRSMSEIAGNTAILIAAEYLSNVNKGKGVMLGGITGITPAEVVILGSGTAAESAARAAMGLGAFVKIIDSSIHNMEQLQHHLGMRLYTSVLHPQVLRKAFKSADVVIGAIHFADEDSKFVVTEDMVAKMKKGSVIVDISIDQGGCFETSECRDHGNPVFTKYDVIHYCVPNIPSRVARTASIAMSNVISPLLHEIAEYGSITNKMKADIGLRHGIYVYNGILTNLLIGNQLGIPSQDINLLMAAF